MLYLIMKNKIKFESTYEKKALEMSVKAKVIRKKFLNRNFYDIFLI